MPVVIVLYIFLLFSLIATLLCHILVTNIIAAHNPAVINHLDKLVIKMCRNCLPVLSLYAWKELDMEKVSIWFRGSWRKDWVSSSRRVSTYFREVKVPLTWKHFRGGRIQSILAVSMGRRIRSLLLLHLNSSAEVTIMIVGIVGGERLLT